MKHSRPLMALGAGCVVAATLTTVVPATAAPVSPGDDFSVASPTIIEVGGETIRNPDLNPYHIIRGTNRKPSFTVMAGDPSQAGRRMAVENGDGSSVCEAEVQPDLLATCTPTTALELGEYFPYAVIHGSDGYESQPSTLLDLRLGYENPTITIDSYDTATKTAKLSGAAEGWLVTVQNATSMRQVRTNPATGAWAAELPIIDAQLSIDASVSYDELVSRSSAWLPDAQTPAPKVSTTQSGGRVTFHIEGDSGSVASIRNADGKQVAEAFIENGRTDATIDDPAHEARYSVTLRPSGGRESDPTSVIVNEGIGAAAPAAPLVGAPKWAAGRAIVPVTGEQGSVVTVKSLDGRVVAIRLLGASGTGQVTIPQPKGRAAVNAFTAEQSRDGATSPSTMFTVASH